MNNQTKLLVTKRDIARLCSVSTRTIDSWVASRKIPVIKTSLRKNLFRVDGVMAALEKLERRAIN